jgi:protein TonB
MLTTTLQRRIRSSHVFLITSVVVHALLLCIPLASSVVPKQTVPQNRLFAVELLVPEQEAEEKSTRESTDTTPALFTPPPAKAPIQKAHKKPEPQKKDATKLQAREATVSLDRMSDDDVQYRSYLGHLRSKIGAVWEYPSAAREKGLNGVVTVRFTIALNGNLKALTIKKESSHRLLDNEALRTIRAAAPFLPFPSEFSIETLHVLASFEYEFSER